VVSLVAILTLAVPAPAAAPDLVRALERLPLPAAVAVTEVRVEPLESRVVLVAPAGAPALAKALGRLGSVVCPRAEARGAEVRLHCRTTRLAAALIGAGPGRLLELRDLAGLPVEGELGFPLLPYDTEALGLGPCPGETPAARGECLLKQGEREKARRALSEAEGEEARGLAALRLGDLALLAGNPHGAQALWLQASLEPWRTVAAARACEITPCASSPASDALFQPGGLPQPLADDLVVRGARALAYRGRLAEGAALLLHRPEACAAAALFCDRLLLSALRSADSGDAALALYLDTPDRDRHPLALELARAAAERADAAGAPAFAGNLLASVTRLVPDRQLEEHLLHAAELYLEGADPVRAQVVTEFARLRAGKRPLTGHRWAAVQRALKAEPRPAARVASGDPSLDLAAAAAAVARGRALVPPEGRP